MNKIKFTKYLLKLVTHANLHGIKVQFKVGEEDRYIPSRNLIIIDGDIEDYDEDTLISLLHELGHVYDREHHTPKDIPKFNKAYPTIYNSNPPKSIVKYALMFERRAWRYGKDIAKRLGITLSSEYDKQAKLCIQDYRNS